MRIRAISLAATLVAFLLPVRAGADQLRGTYQGEVAERSHRVTIERKDNLAIFTVTRVLRNTGTDPEQLELSIDLPTGAVADRFRHKMTGRWQRGELMDAELAESIYETLTSSGKLRRRGPAVLSKRYQGLTLKVYPVAAGASVTAEYRLRAPLCYRNGHWYTDYPVPAPEADDLAAPKLRARGGTIVDLDQLLGMLGDDDLVECSGIGVASSGPSTRYIVFRGATPRGPLAARLGHHRIDDDRHLVRVEVAVPPIIEPAPRRARLVFVIDGSHSQGISGVEQQLELVRGYVSHLPDARVEIVVYRRWAHRLFGGFVPARQLDARLKAVHPQRLRTGNGSHLDLGLGLAAELLAGQRGPARIIAFSDVRLRPSFDYQQASRLVSRAPEHAVLHLVWQHAGSSVYHWSRNQDNGPLVALAATRGGVLADLYGSRGGLSSAREAMLGLVRPLVIDDVELSVPGFSEVADVDLPVELAGGDGFRQIWLTGAAPKGARITGKIWGRTVELGLTADAAMSKQALALAFGHVVERELPEDRLADLAMAAGVVSEATSFLSRSSGLEPTSHEIRGMVGRSSTCGCGLLRRRSITCGLSVGVATGSPSFGHDRREVLRAMLSPHVRACRAVTGPGGSVAITVDTTGAEIVDVRVETSNAELAACVEREAWRLALPATVFDQKIDRFIARY